MKLFVAAFLFFFTSLSLNGQIARVFGIIQSDTSERNYIALVKLVGKDTMLLKSTRADSSGSFSLYIFKTGEYRFLIEKPGYLPFYSNLFRVDSVQKTAQIDQGVLVLSRDIRTLGVVEVFGRKRFIERKFNKTIVNVEKSIYAQGNSMYELLPILPGIRLGAGGEIKVNGKTNILFQVDGKGQLLPGDQAMEMLKSMNASSIEKIEIINNPSAKYDASISAVINIVTIKKKSKNDIHVNLGSLLYPVNNRNGFNDSYSNIGIYLNDRVRKVNLSGSVDIRNNKGFEESDDKISFMKTNPTLFRNSQSVRTTNNTNLNIVAGLNYEINKRQFIDFRINTIQYLRSTNNNSTSVDFLTPGNFNSDSGILYSGKNRNRNFYTNTFNGKYVVQFRKTGEEAAFYADLNDFSFQRNGNYLNRIVYSLPPSYSESPLFTDWLYSVRISSVKTDYTYPLGKDQFLDAGAKLSFVRNISDYTQNQSTNNFLYKETISAGYLSLRGEKSKFSYEFGVRLENTNSKGRVLNPVNSLTRKYVNLFPTATADYTINDNNSISLSFKSTIVRPTYADFNPVPILYSPFSLLNGNIRLNPKITKTVEFSYTYKDYSITLTNDYAKDVRGSIIDSASTPYFITNKIISYRYLNQAIIELDVPISAGKKWSSNNSFSGYITTAKLVNGKVDSYTSFDIMSNHSLKISGTLNLNLILTYSYFDKTGYDKSYPLFNGRFSLQKSWADKYILNVSFNDLFGTAKLRYFRDYGYITQDSPAINNNRNFRVSFKYKFNASTLVSKKDKNTKDTQAELRY